jgi:hypothetical protein
VISFSRRRSPTLDKEEIKRLYLELGPTVRAFAKSIADMRGKRVDRSRHAAMLGVEVGNHGKLNDVIFELIMAEPRRVAQASMPQTLRGSTLQRSRVVHGSRA